VILDVFSRYIVGWMIAPRKSAELARKLSKDTCSKQQNPSRITDHSCRSRLIDDIEAGCLLMADLGVTKTHSRIHSQVFFSWYNDEHRHSGIGMLTPAMVHYGHAE